MRYFRTWIVAMLVLSRMDFCNGQFDTVFKAPRELQIRLLDSIAFDLVFIGKRDSLPFHLEKMRSLAIERRDYRFKIISELGRMRLEYFNGSFSAKEESIRFNQLLNNARENQDTILITYMCMRFGDILRDNSKYAMAISYYLICFNYLKTLDDRMHNINVGFFENQLAAFFYHIGEYHKSLDILKDSKASKGMDYQAMGCYDLWSQVCLKLKDYECSKNMIEKAYSIYRVSDTSSWFFKGWTAVFIGNLGKIAFHQNRFDQAIPLLKEGFRIAQYAHMHNNVASFGLLLAHCYIYTHQVSRAAGLLPTIKEAVYQQNDPQFHVDYYQMCLVLSPGLSHASIGLQYFDSLDHYNIRLQDRKNKDNKIKEDLALELASQEHFRNQLQQKVSRQLKIRNTSIGLIFMLFVGFAGAIYQKQKQLARQKSLIREVEEKAALDLAEAREELNRFKEYLLEKNRQFISLESGLGVPGSNSELEELKLSVILTDEDWKNFKTLFNRVYPNFIEQLVQAYPGLTQGEVRYFLLLRLGLDNREMASILGVSPGAMRTLKSRICKKLNLDEKTSLGSLTAHF